MKGKLMPRPTNFFENLGGVPVHYDRLASPHNYGTRGKATRFFCTEGVETKLNQCFRELWDVCPLGQAQVITSAGAWVDKPGFHGSGRAFDLDGIFWANKSFVTLSDGFMGGDRKFYHAVEAIIRRHFGTVLDYHYNADHRDHFHLDDGTAVDFDTGSLSRVKFLQAALTFIHDQEIRIDGAFGPQTRQAITVCLNALDISGNVDTPTVWKEFLLKTARKGFEAASVTPTEKNPLELLHDLYDVIEQTLDSTGLRKQVEGALNAFANHEATQNWLDSFR
jgi:hypothetical protein